MEQKIDRKKEKKQNVICICGMTGCGKSTLAKQLANKYELKYFSGGDTLKALANEIGYKQSGKDWWETKEGTRFLQQRIKENKFDKKVDKKLIKLAEQGNVVLDHSRAAHHQAGSMIEKDASSDRNRGMNIRLKHR